MIEKWHQYCDTRIAGYTKDRFGNTSKVRWESPDNLNGKSQLLAEEYESLHGCLFELSVTNEELEEQSYAYKGEVGNYGRIVLDEEKLSAFRQLVSTKYKAVMDNIQELKSFSRGAGRLLFAFNDVDNIMMMVDRQETDLGVVATGPESLKTTYG